MSEGRLNDLDALGPASRCKPLPAWLWVSALTGLVVLAGVAIALEELL